MLKKWINNFQIIFFQTIRFDTAPPEAAKRTHHPLEQNQDEDKEQDQEDQFQLPEEDSLYCR